MGEKVDHPSHYGGANNPYEAIKVIEAWLGKEGAGNFCIGNALKYLCRAGKKEGNGTKQDLEKACWYINRAISYLSDERKGIDCCG